MYSQQVTDEVKRTVADMLERIDRDGVEAVREASRRLDKFLKTCTYQRLAPGGTRRVAPAIAAIFHAERMEGHARTAEMRLEPGRAGTGVTRPADG